MAGRGFWNGPTIGILAAVAVTAALLEQRRDRRRAGESRARPTGGGGFEERYPDPVLGPDGRMDPDTMTDLASAASFPASDPPAFASLSRIGGPPH